MLNFRTSKFKILFEQKKLLNCFLFLGLTKLRELMRLPGLEVFVRQVEPHSYLSVLREIKEKEYNNLIIDTNPDFMNEFLKGVRKTIIRK